MRALRPPRLAMLTDGHGRPPPLHEALPAAEGPQCTQGRGQGAQRAEAQGPEQWGRRWSDQGSIERALGERAHRPSRSARGGARGGNPAAAGAQASPDSPEDAAADHVVRGEAAAARHQLLRGAGLGPEDPAGTAHRRRQEAGRSQRAHRRRGGAGEVADGRYGLFPRPSQRAGHCVQPARGDATFDLRGRVPGAPAHRPDVVPPAEPVEEDGRGTAGLLQHRAGAPQGRLRGLRRLVHRRDAHGQLLLPHVPFVRPQLPGGHHVCGGPTHHRSVHAAPRQVRRGADL
mmetsp:Transcript_6417/g.18173  ORF Transcript_6417/g.18173 Transcript_6417/m.18173 type:complete len:288 (-) Transcript_6417:1773-2636(-)